MKDFIIEIIPIRDKIFQKFWRRMKQIPIKLDKKTNISFSSCSDSQTALMLMTGNFIPTNQVNTFVVTISPNEITGGLVDVVTYILREPSNMHVVRWNGGEHI